MGGVMMLEFSRHHIGTCHSTLDLLEEGDLCIKDKIAGPNVSFILECN